MNEAIREWERRATEAAESIAGADASREDRLEALDILTDIVQELRRDVAGEGRPLSFMGQVQAIARAARQERKLAEDESK